MTRAHTPPGPRPLHCTLGFSRSLPGGTNACAPSSLLSPHGALSLACLVSCAPSTDPQPHGRLQGKGVLVIPVFMTDAGGWAGNRVSTEDKGADPLRLGSSSDRLPPSGRVCPPARGSGCSVGQGPIDYRLGTRWRTRRHGSKPSRTEKPTLCGTEDFMQPLEMIPEKKRTVCENY